MHAPQAVYRIPTLETDEASSSLAVALQSLFYKVSVHACVCV